MRSETAGDRLAVKSLEIYHHCVESAWRVVDLAMDVSGGRGMAKGTELERLFRDTRAGRFHPANILPTHEIAGKTALGIDWTSDTPRWG